MKKCRPSKWVPWALVGAGLPWLAAVFLTTEELKNDVLSRATGSLTANQTSAWAALSFDGRDATISGTATSQEAVNAAIEAVRSTYGVRSVVSSAEVVVPLTPPTVESGTADTATPEIKGTWPHDRAKTLAVTVAGTTYRLGQNPELTATDANWSLKLATPLADGDYDVSVEASDGDKLMAAAPIPGKITIKVPDTTGPVAPVIVTSGGTSLIGTFDEADTAAFSATVDGREYILNRGAALTSDGAGNFTFAPARKFAPGSYDVDFKLTDAIGNVTGIKAEKAIVIPEPPPPPDTAGPATPVISASGAQSFSGTFDEADTKSFIATVDGREYVLNRGAALTSDGAGHFTFAPARKFAPGSYDVEFKLADSIGNVTVSKSEKAIVIPEPTPLPDTTAPAMPVLSTSGVQTLVGTFDEADTKSFTATVDGREYVLNRGAALKSDGAGNFTFAPARRFAPGSYDVEFKLVDATGNVAVSKYEKAIVVPEPLVAVTLPDIAGPAMPMITTPGGLSLTGTFDEADTKSFTAKVGNREYVLNRGAALTSDGAGNFTFAPAGKFAPGPHSVEFTLTDALGNVTTATVEKAIVIPEPPPPPAPPAPTVQKMVDISGRPAIRGTWPNAEAKTLQVTVGGTSYVLGTDAGLRADAKGNWRLAPAAALKDGIYDVVAVATNEAGISSKDESVAELDVDAVPPAKPTVEAFAGDGSPAALKGTWDKANAARLTVEIPALALNAELGAPGSALTSDSAGNWTLTLATPATAGIYEVYARSTDRHGRIQDDETAGELAIVVANQPAATGQAYDCVEVLKRIAGVFPLRFNLDGETLDPKYEISLSQYAALLQDPRCAGVHIELAGHADERGSPEYNLALSERRAAAIRTLLQQVGVDPGRLTSRGYGETMPLSTERTRESYAMNRRVEVAVTKR